MESEGNLLVEINRSGAGDNECLLCIKKNVQEGLKSEVIERFWYTSGIIANRKVNTNI